MESGDDVASGKGVLVPVSATSDAFQRSVLAPLKSAYLYEESKQSFTYKSAVLINNPALEKKYDAFRAKRREAGYSEEELKESYGFLLFDDVGKANALGDTGVLTGNSTCTTLGDPSNGVYISMFSDCLDLNRWYHGKSGYIAIIRLTKGRVKKVLENYTQNFTAPNEGFDCHVSEQLPSVSAKTSSFLAFERTQYYMYELLDGGSNETARCPSAACPFAIVSFSYTDTKATLVAPQEKSEEKKLFCHYFPWRGQLQIGTHFYDVGLRSTAGALIPAELPPVVKVDRAISMLDLRQLLPRAVFETCFSGEVFLDGLYCSLYELVSSEAEETSSLSLLLQEIKEKDVALIIPLNDGGFLILLHSSHFLTYDDTGSSATEVLQCMFVFPDSRVIYRGTKLGQRHPAMSSEILRVLPVLSYAEGEVEKTSIDPSEELCEVFVQHMQSYAALINPGLASSPSRDVTIFADQYDVPDAHKHLYSSPEWTNRAWQNFRSYLSKPVSFQLPLSKASEILAVGQEERIEDLDDDVYFCLSSPEEAPANHVGTGSEDQLAGQKSAVNVETSVDSCLTSAEAQVDLADVSHNVVPDDFKTEDATKDTDKSLIKVDDMGTKSPSTADELPAALIVSITSAERTVTSTESATKHIDFQLSGFSADKLQMSGVNSLNDETVRIKKGFDCPEVTNLITTKRRKKRRGRYRSRRYVSKARVETPSLQTVKIPVKDDKLKSQKEDQAKEDDKLKSQKEDQAEEGDNLKGQKEDQAEEEDNLKGQKEDQAEEEDNLKGQKEDQAEEEDNLKGQKEDQAKESGPPQTSNPSNTDWRKVRRRKHTFGKLPSKNKKARSAPVGPTVAEEKKSDHGQQSVESTILMELEAFPLRKKMERWDLKPVISECGRILVPHGSADIANRIKTLKDKLQSTKDEPCLEKLLVDVSVNALDTVKMEQEPSTATRTAVDRTEATTSNPGGNHFQDAIVSHINPEHSILRQSGDGNGLLTLNPERSERSSTNDGTDNPPLETVQEKHADTPSTGRSASKGGFLLSKLKSVLLRGKRKTSVLVPEERTADIVQDTEPCPKKGKVDLDSEMLKSNDAITSVKDTTLAVKEVSKMLSVDPLFAYALGLTPKETPNKLQKSEGQDAQQRKDSSETQEQTILNKQPKIIQRPLSIFPRRDRIKTLKKHQGISAECVRKKWWLHFQTPACFASEKLKECTRDNSVRKTVKEKSNSACSSTDALNLLADLALGASKNQVPPQPAPALEREPETSLKKCDLRKEVTGGEHKSVLHALLRQPAARPSHLLVSPSPSHFVGGSELVELVSKEHAYSLPPSSSLLLGLSGTPFQVSPLSGSTRLLHHHQTMYGDGIKTLHSSIDLEDRGERNHRTPECLKKQMARRRKFRHSRTFVNKDASVQVTKEWKEDYDFNLDSKFTSDSKHRAIIRALHGPWDLSIQDTNEELQLIFHMWIGLFYSRSTARFFHIDSNCADLCSEESDSLKTSSGTVSPPAQSELKAKSSTPLANATDTSDTLSSKALDLSKKENSALDQGSVVLDLSLRNSNAEIVASDPQVNKKETSVAGKQKESSETLNTLKSPVGLQNESTIQYFRTSVPSEIINKVNDVRSTYESKRTSTPLQSADCLEHTNVPSFKGGGTFISIREMLESVSVRPSNYQTASGIGRVLRGYNSEKTYLKRGLGNSEAPGMSLVQKQERVSSKSVRDKGMDSNEKAGDVVRTTEHDEIKSKDGENWEVKEKPYQKGKIELSPKMIHPGDDSANDGRVCNQNLLENENEKQLSREEPKAASPGKADNGNENVDCCTEHEDELIKDDHVGKEDRLDEKECRVSDVEADSNLNNQPLPMMSDGPDLVKKDCITECSHQTPLDEQPPQADTKEDVCHDLQLNQWCANGSALTHEDAMSEKAPHAPSEMEPIHSEPAVEKHSENDVHLAKLSDQSVSDGPDALKKDCITECNHQAALDEQLPQADTTEDACHDLHLNQLCANGSALTDEDAMSGKAPHSPSEVEPFHSEPAVEEHSENGICLAKLNDQPVSDGPDSIKKDCITECSRQTPSDEQLPQTDSTEDACHDLQLGKLCANGSALTDEDAMSGKASHAPSEVEPFHSEPAVEEISENICLAKLSDQPVSDGPDALKKDCITECNHQAPSDEQLPQAETTEDACHDLQLNRLCANGSALTDEDALSGKAPHSPSEVQPIHSEPAVEDISENDICLSNLSDQPVSDGPDSIKKDCITECSRQTPSDEQLPQADAKEDACHDLQLGKLCANGSALTHEDAMSEKASHAPSEVEPFHSEPAVEETSENNICLSDEAHFQKVALPMSDKSTFSINRSIADGSIPQTNDVKSQNKVMANLSLSSNDHEDQDTKSFEGEQNVVHTTQKELFCHESHSPQCKAVTKCEAGVALTKETDLKTEKTNEEFEEIPGRVIIPFIGIDTSGEHPIQSYDSYSKGKIEIPFISDATYPETVLPTGVCSTSAAQMYIKKAELSAGKTSLSLLDISETNQPVSGSESEDRCPTPTMDEKPYQCVTRTGPSSCSSSAVNVSETLKKTQRWFSRSPAFIKDAMPLEQKHRSTVNSDPNPHHGLHPDLEQRTLRVLQSVDMFLSKRNHGDKSSHIKTAEVKHSLDQTINTNSKYIPTCLALSHTSANFMNKGISSTNPAVASASTSQEVLSVRLQLNKTDSSIHQRYLKNTVKLQETSVSPELRSYSQRPVMAVKPSKSDEIQADCISKDRETENPVRYNLSKKKQTKTHIVLCTTPASMLLEKPTESLKGNSARLNDDKQEAIELSSKSSWLSDVSDSKSNSEEAKFTFLDSLCWYEGRDTSKFTKSPSSLPMQSFEYAKMLSELDDEKRSFLTNSLVEKVGQTAKEGIKMIQKDLSDASTSVVDYKEDILDDSLLLGPHCSLTCTVYNTSQKVSKSFLEQLSQRCLQHDLTQASMEQECLIFSEQMKQLLKRSKRGPVNQEGAHDKSSLPCSSPVTVHFSSLEEQEDSVDHLDAPSLFRQKIKVDMSDRKDTTEEENTVPSPEFSQGTGNPVEHAGVSGVTAECARLYTAMMNDVCAVPSRPKHLRMDSGYLKTEPSNLFDFCDQMKREVDESFRSNLNSVVKKSCKAKYRFYILVTSDDPFFEETKAQLEAEGHTAVQPSEFFPGEDSSSSLLIVLRNEDIAEHICEVPQLLELKKSPGVQFAGIDEPDDVVNLTYQELFLRGGFIMFDRAALESLNLCNMKKMSEMLQELSRTGKWKWMLHYRDSRRLKENARLSAEAKEKKYFLNWCQEVGILEVLTYHECDLTSKEQPDYLTCLVRLQVQNITARYTVFVTDAATDSTFATNGILTMTLNSFLTSSLSETLSLT